MATTTSARARRRARAARKQREVADHPLRLWRESVGLSRLALAHATGVPYTELRMIELRKRDARWSTVDALMRFVMLVGGGGVKWTDFWSEQSIRREKRLAEEALRSGAW